MEYTSSEFSKNFRINYLIYACGHQLVKHVVNSEIWGFMWSDLRGSLAEFLQQNARKWAISGEKQRKKEILANLLFGLSDKT